MKKQKKRMTNLDIQMVVEEINAWANGERSKKLTWKVLENVFPFTRQTMYSKSEIKIAYEKAQIALRTGKKPKIANYSRQSDELKIQRLKARIRELEKQIEEFQELWVRYEYQALKKGLI